MSAAESFLAKNLPYYYPDESQEEKIAILLKEIVKVDGDRAREIENSLKQFSKNSVEGQSSMNFETFNQSTNWR